LIDQVIDALDLKIGIPAKNGSNPEPFFIFMRQIYGMRTAFTASA
jgi:hypothetical protein